MISALPGWAFYCEEIRRKWNEIMCQHLMKSTLPQLKLRSDFHKYFILKRLTLWVENAICMRNIPDVRTAKTTRWRVAIMNKDTRLTHLKGIFYICVIQCAPQSWWSLHYDLPRWPIYLNTRCCMPSFFFCTMICGIEMCCICSLKNCRITFKLSNKMTLASRTLPP